MAAQDRSDRPHGNPCYPLKGKMSGSKIFETNEAQECLEKEWDKERDYYLTRAIWNSTLAYYIQHVSVAKAIEDSYRGYVDLVL